MLNTLDTSHFEMSELNASALKNAAESKKERDRSKEEKSQRVTETKSVQFLKQKEKEKRGKVLKMN